MGNKGYGIIGISAENSELIQDIKTKTNSSDYKIDEAQEQRT